MIDKKKIEKAADKYVKETCTEDMSPVTKVTAEMSFHKGIDWFLNNLWHPTSEEPKEKQKLIVEMTNEECHSAYRINKWYYISDVNMECEVSVKTDSIYRWLYIDDLLTKEGGDHD